MARQIITVVLIEDDLMVQEVNRGFIEKVDGFKVVGCASNGIDGIKLIRELDPDLAIVDIYMPDMDGLETIKEIRSEEHKVDIIAVTAASDMETVSKVLRQGAVDYVMKPFKFERMKKALEHYRTVRSHFTEKRNLSQKELDEIMFQKESEETLELPKGLNSVTLKKVIAFLTSDGVPVSADEVAEGVGMARVTARRYLEYLEKCGKVRLDVQYGGVGRPINRYIMI